jgi:hypothetical protein
MSQSLRKSLRNVSKGWPQPPKPRSALVCEDRSAHQSEQPLAHFRDGHM